MCTCIHGKHVHHPTVLSSTLEIESTGRVRITGRITAASLCHKYFYTHWYLYALCTDMWYDSQHLCCLDKTYTYVLTDYRFNAEVMWMVKSACPGSTIGTLFLKSYACKSSNDVIGRHFSKQIKTKFHYKKYEKYILDIRRNGDFSDRALAILTLN